MPQTEGPFVTQEGSADVEDHEAMVSLVIIRLTKGVKKSKR
jgi:hypothetical protein